MEHLKQELRDLKGSAAPGDQLDPDNATVGPAACVGSASSAVPVLALAEKPAPSPVAAQAVDQPDDDDEDIVPLPEWDCPQGRLVARVEQSGSADQPIVVAADVHAGVPLASTCWPLRRPLDRLPAALFSHGHTLSGYCIAPCWGLCVPVRWPRRLGSRVASTIALSAGPDWRSLQEERLAMEEAALLERYQKDLAAAKRASLEACSSLTPLCFAH